MHMNCVMYEIYTGFIHVFFFKQMTAYEMRISDWSSDVCSSDLLLRPPPEGVLSYRRARGAGHSDDRCGARPMRTDTRGANDAKRAIPGDGGLRRACGGRAGRLGAATGAGAGPREPQRAVEGESGVVRVDLGEHRIMTKNK